MRWRRSEADGFEPFAAEDEHRDVDAGAVDFDFAGEEGRCGFGALGVARRLRARARRARGGAGGSGHGWLLGIQVTRSAVGDGPRRLMVWTPPLLAGMRGCRDS